MSWRKIALKDLGQIIGGGTPSTKESLNFGDDYPWITPKDLSRQGRRYIDHGERGITIEGLKRSSAKLLPAGSVIVSSRAPIGLTAITTVPIATNQGCRSFVPGRDADSLFMYYLLGSMTDQMERLANGSTFKEISGSTLAAIEVSVPEIEEQRAIAATLGALDDKIESNRRTINKILALGHALYEEALASGSRRTRVEEIAEFHNRRRIPLSSRERDVRHGNVPYYGATGIFGYVDDFLFNEVLVLVGEDGSVVCDDGGPVTQYIWGKAWINNHAHPLTGRGISNELLYLALDRSDIRPLVTGAVQPKISMGNLKSLVVDLPLESEQARLDSMLSSLFSVLRCRSDEVRQLEHLRDTLLPELLSGRIRGPRACEEVKGDVA